MFPDPDEVASTFAIVNIKKVKFVPPYWTLLTMPTFCGTPVVTLQLPVLIYFALKMVVHNQVSRILGSFLKSLEDQGSPKHHSSIQTDEKPYVCAECKTSFLKLTELNMHLKSSQRRNELHMHKVGKVFY